MHLLRVLANEVDGDVDLMVAEADEAVVPREWLVAEIASVIVDEVQRAEPLDKARDYMLAGRSDDISCPDKNSSQRRCWPHGGCQLSWWCHGRCHG
jgi:hypothetical protein